eukprot:CAMPEP_0117541568 /NCGR_PEP_ID=MMETSP0784-20121206/44087_1 /TAXON_ID=39447 /ORGANISM="" /LENGTH=129 /DNA_ID=CAMNT_0005338269 /DNA_START=109 /DNA_END=499 /DNA_ORIENTATION=-
MVQVQQHGWTWTTYLLCLECIAVRSSTFPMEVTHNPQASHVVQYLEWAEQSHMGIDACCVNDLKGSSGKAVRMLRQLCLLLLDHTLIADAVAVTSHCYDVQATAGELGESLVRMATAASPKHTASSTDD